MYKVKDGRLKPKPVGTFGKTKKPFKGKNRNRKGSVLHPDRAVRVDARELDRRVDFILSKEFCQVCEDSFLLDYPHHVVQGIGVKDDQSLICICVSCHRLIHACGYDSVKKSREECEAIAEKNNLEFIESCF